MTVNFPLPGVRGMIQGSIRRGRGSVRGGVCGVPGRTRAMLCGRLGCYAGSPLKYEVVSRGLKGSPSECSAIAWGITYIDI